VSQIPYKFPDRAVREAVHLREMLDLKHIGVEIIPLRTSHPEHLAFIVENAQVKVAVAGVTTARFKDYANDLVQFRGDIQTIKEIGMNMVAIGSQDEPGISRVFVSHISLALRLKASYLAMHEESTRLLEQQQKLESWTTTGVLYARKLGWGPQENRHNPLSWDIHAIEAFVSRWQEYGANMTTLLPTDTALRTGLTLAQQAKRYDLLKAWQVLNPRIIQVADYDPNGKKEKLPPGRGKYKQELETLIQESSRVSPHTIYTVEVASPQDVAPTIEFILDNYRG
jgi:hypothetical protein